MRTQAMKSFDQHVRTAESPVVFFAVPDMDRLVSLGDSDRREVMDFLSLRPVHTVVMAAFITDNGFESKYNRGRFFGYRGTDGTLEGVALIGHSTLIEARSEVALRAFAIQARKSEVPIHVMMSEGRVIERFWNYFRSEGAEPRFVYTEKLFEIGFPFPAPDCEYEIVAASPKDLNDVAVAHADVAFLESGVNPLELDPEDFLDRCLRRIEQGRTYVAYIDGEVAFKADVVAESETVVYLEGVWVSEKMRGRGIGTKCLAKLSARLLENTNNVCLLSNLDFKAAHRSFEKAGFRGTDECTTIFV